RNGTATVSAMLRGSAVSFYPDLRTHGGPIDEFLAPITQVGHELIDGFDLADFLAGGATVPLGFGPLMRIPQCQLLRIKGTLSGNLPSKLIAVCSIPDSGPCLPVRLTAPSA